MKLRSPELNSSTAMTRYSLPILVVPLALTLFFMGCANSANLAVELRSRTFDESPEDVYDASLAYLARNGFEIAQASPETRTITTEYKRGSGLWTYYRERVSVFIRDLDSGESELTLTITEQEQKGDEWVDYRRLSASQAKGKYVEHLDGIASLL